ncbi:hypothetical protein V9T40_012206 [Parthenolecanium corni]|uniref:RNA-directed DNA polymerase n=1 Tax=Parthenolecanium corni TaxID=536013 RepID=A0AAN9T936_9HEMI
MNVTPHSFFQDDDYSCSHDSCPGDSGDKCGNKNRVRIFRTRNADPVELDSEPKLLGCYQDQERYRALDGGKIEAIDRLSPALCIDICKSRGFEFSGAGVTANPSASASVVKMANSVVLFQEFNPDAEDIGSYLDRFECFATVNSIEDAKKAKFFIASVGAVVYQRLLLLAIPKKPTELTYAEIEAALRAEYKKKPLTHVARHNFRQRKQANGESFRDFYNALKELSQDCDFENANVLKEELKSQIISGIRDAKTQSFFFMQSKLTLDDVTKKAEIDEQAGVGVQHFKNGHENPSRSDVHKINEPFVRKKFQNRNNPGSYRGNSRNSSQRPQHQAQQHQQQLQQREPYVCYRCTRQGHKADSCYYRSATCNKCKRIGHIAAACGKTRDDFRKSDPAKVNLVDDSNPSDPYEVVPISSIADRNFDEYIVEEVCNIQTRDPKDKVFVQLCVDNVPVVFEADSGSRFAIMSKANFSRLNICKPLLSCKIILKSYTGNFIFVLGYVNVNVTYKTNVFSNLKLLIVDENFDTVFGREWWYTIHFDIFDHFNKPVSIHKIDVPFDLTNALNNVVIEFNDIFEDCNGVLKNVIEHVSVRSDAKPIFCRHRNVVYSLRDPVFNEIDRLVSAGIYESVTSSEWATPLVVVQKSGRAVRLVGDYSVTVNQAIIPEDYPIPNIEEILYDFGCCKFFSKFDVREAFLHMPVDEETAKLLTVNTTKGLFKGVGCFYDDIKISSDNAHIHLASIRQFFEICRENGIKLRKSKCQLLSDELDYLGFRVNAKGIHKTSEKVDAVLKAPPPKNVTEVKSFTGLVVFYSRFLPNMSTVLHPINHLLRKDVKFDWSAECQSAFNAIKREIASPRVLCHFDPRKKLILATDASPYAVGAVLSHQFDDGERPIAFASRALSKAEANYSQIDKESLAIFWGVKRFFNYLYGRPFILYVDCKPLQSIFAKNAAKPALSATRLLHYAIFLQGFNYEIKYRRSEDHSNADFLSRFPVEPAAENKVDEPSVVNMNQIAVLPMAMQELADESARDVEIAQILKQLNSELPKDAHLKQPNVFTEFTVEKGCVLYGTRVFVPKKFRTAILQELHVGHLGMSKMKGLARSYVYWPGLDKEIEDLVRSCEPCQRNAKAVSVPSHPWEPPSAPWERVHIDYAGPFLQFNFLIVVDAYSKWPEVFISPVSKKNDTNSAATIEKLVECFARFGCPSTLVSDNGVQFTSREFKEFCKRNFIRQVHSAPYHPQSNGQAERFVQTFKRALRIAVLEKPEESVARKLQRFLMAYRRAPLRGGESPSQLMLGRNVRTRIDILQNVENCLKDFEPTTPDGSAVWFRVFDGPRNWNRGTLVRRIGQVMVEVQDAKGCLHRRHLSQVRGARPEGPCSDHYPVHSDWKAEATKEATPAAPPPPPLVQYAAPEIAEDPPIPDPPANPPRRPERTRKPPERFSP